ncbi:CvpA family protein [Lentilactobacillus parafarraginis]|jgi:uncharacterized membrane protein required for colicin V production|uniref:CvpA family protein n=2 Tax=Lentilactobacillus parafarraginis TaxID=390842 RepID=A0A0R1YVF3_9LACO|nr:CvpA family protein [Lentilactobacillus parafarraginis]KRM43043.1 CvpA family protein [Lentilactobacillus parafarraginis DSM 18390 = JCM 14109]TLQ16200.1 CvpA family protein [Lentilactobacillus parafarraginis]
MILSLIVIACLIGGVVSGFRRGFVSQSVSIVSLILAFIVAIYYFQSTANYVIDFIKKFNGDVGVQWLYVTDIIAFVVLFSLTRSVYLMLGRALNAVVKLPVLHLGNQLLGSVIGVVAQYLIIFFVLNVLILFPINWFQTQYQDSGISQTIVKKTPVLSQHAGRVITTHHAAVNNQVNDGRGGTHEMA